MSVLWARASPVHHNCSHDCILQKRYRTRFNNFWSLICVMCYGVLSFFFESFGAIFAFAERSRSHEKRAEDSLRPSIGMGCPRIDPLERNTSEREERERERERETLMSVHWISFNLFYFFLMLSSFRPCYLYHMTG
ncbi:hypothetical protein EUGRSUZ_H02270 [Eucalyptus grandis]|uniref:Uncharacterized protein n=2 Tax=Eucalyptus grandis TaxID=71139 RepID=A0ACC3JQZ2_EUCGR|nr:hypothetical protein EUGRSUZ_H02270 [Eucalyptus grandis]